METKPKQGLRKGICKYCRAVHVTPRTKHCPVCNQPDPHTTVARKVRSMLQLGGRLEATRILTKIAGWDMEEALAYIESLSVKTVKLPRFASLVTSDDVIREYIVKGDLKEAIDYVMNTRRPLSAWSDAEAMSYIRLTCPDLVE